MNEDRLKWAVVVGLTILFVVLSIWNENHLGKNHFLTDPLLYPIVVIWAGVVLWYTWWYKMKDGNPREFSITGNFTIANNDPMCYIKAKGPWPKLRVYARNGIWRPKFVLNFWGGGKKYGYDINPDYCYENLGVQVLNKVARKKKYVTPEQKSELPPHVIPDLIAELELKGLQYDHETTPLFMGQRPLKLPPGLTKEEIDDQSDQIAELCVLLTEAKENAKDWKNRYSSMLRSIKAQDSGLLKKIGIDEGEYQRSTQYGDGHDRNR